MRERLLFCLLLIGMMLYYALPKLSFTGSTEQTIFSVSWLLLAFLAVGGNVATVLFSSNRKQGKKMKKSHVEKKRVREYE